MTLATLYFGGIASSKMCIRDRGSEFTCDMASARSAGASRSNLIPAPLGSSFLTVSYTHLALYYARSEVVERDYLIRRWDLKTLVTGAIKADVYKRQLLACERAEDFCEREGVEKGGFACASDAFFPFRDNVDVLAAHGVTLSLIHI